MPFRATSYAETLPTFAPPCALETYNCDGFVGRNSLPNGPTACAGNGEPGAATRCPSRLTLKLSTNDGPAAGPTSVATRLVPVELNRMSPGSAVGFSGIVDPSSGVSRPAASMVKQL